MSHYNPESHGGIYCMMSGKPMTPQICDVLMYNAVDMFECGVTSQRIKGQNYDGIINSNLEVVEAMFPIVVFEAILATGTWDAKPVKFYIRVDDLVGIRGGGRWGRIMATVMGLNDIPNHIKQAMLEDEELPEEIREEIARSMNDGPEFDLGEPTYG